MLITKYFTLIHSMLVHTKGAFPVQQRKLTNRMMRRWRN